MGLPRARSTRDVVLILLGAAVMYIASGFMGIFTEHLQQPIFVSHQVSVSDGADAADVHSENLLLQQQLKNLQDAAVSAPLHASHASVITDLSYELPETTVDSHAPGWTLFRNVYMSGGTFFVVSSQPRSAFPDIRLITSTGLPAENTPENIAARMPTAKDMDFITPAEARKRWGSTNPKDKNRVWNVGGTTFFINEPSQFLDHYYHFCAEWLFGAWAFWMGSHNIRIDDPRTLAVKDTPPITRAIFAHAEATGWRDRPGFNSYFFRAAFPSVTIEVQQDWEDRIAATTTHLDGQGERAWHFDTLLLTDRSAAFRGESCGLRNQRIASESIEYMQRIGNLTRYWWEPVRREVLRFAGLGQETLDIGLRKEGSAKAGAGDSVGSGLLAEDVVITYISRQGTRRHLIDEDHEALVKALTAMCTKHGWELNVVQAERLTKEQQFALAARTTVMLGVHGNGLTHLIMMPVTPVSMVVEMFYPEGFAHDYEWTTQALGMRHVAIWNDTYHTYPDTPSIGYPEGFQGTQIPVYPPTVTKVIENRIAGWLP